MANTGWHQSLREHFILSLYQKPSDLKYWLTEDPDSGKNLHIQYLNLPVECGLVLPSAPSSAGMQINKSLTCCRDRAGPEISAK